MSKPAALRQSNLGRAAIVTTAAASIVSSVQFAGAVNTWDWTRSTTGNKGWDELSSGAWNRNTIPQTNAWPDAAGEVVNFTNNISGGVQTVNSATAATSFTVGLLTFGDSNTSDSFSFTLSGKNLILDNGGNAAQLNQRSTSKGDTISAPIKLNSNLDITNSSAANTMSLSSGGISANTTGLKTITNKGSGSATLSGVVADGSGQIAVTQNTAGTLILSGANTYSGGTTVTAGTFQTTTVAGGLGSGNISVASGATLAFYYDSSVSYTVAGTVSGAGNVSVTGSGIAISPLVTLVNPTISGNVTFSAGTGTPGLVLADFTNQTISGVISASAGSNLVQKTGTGTLTYSGSNSTGIAGSGFATRINGGTLVLDYTINNNNKLGDFNGLSLGGGAITLKGGTQTGATPEVVGSTTIQAGGATIIKRDSVTPGTSTLRLNVFSRSNGGTVNFAASGLADSDTANAGTSGATGILGAWATVGTTGAADWARTVDTGAADTSITALPSGNYAAYVTASGVSTTNYLLTGTSTSATQTINTLKINTSGAGQSLSLGASILTLGNQVTNNYGGILFVGSDGYEIKSTTGLLKPVNNTGADLIIQQWGAGTLTISAVIANGAGTCPLTKAGPGTLVLSGANTYTGVTNINQGIVSISSNVNLGAETTGAVVNINGATLQATETFALANSANVANNIRAVVLGGGGATFDIANAKTLTVPGVVSNATNNAVGSLTKTGPGSLALSNTNTYTGPTSIAGGTLSITSAGSINTTTGITIDGGRLDHSSSVALTRPITFKSGILAGAGAIAGAVTVGDGSGTADSTLAPGSSIESLDTGNLTFASDGVYQPEIDGATADRTNVAGAVTLAGNTLAAATLLDVQIINNAPVLNQLYFIIDNDGGPSPAGDAVSGLFKNGSMLLNQDSTFDVTYLASTYRFKISYTGNLASSEYAVAGGNDVVLQNIAIPEPGTFGLVGMSVLGLMTTRRRRWK